MRRRILFVCVMLLLAGCSAGKLVPDDYSGPTAVVRDSSVEGGSAGTSHSQYFVLMAVDGKEIPSSFSETFAGAEGFTNFRAHERKVPVKPIKATLRAVAYFPKSIKGPGGPSGLDEVTAGVIQNTVDFSPVAGEVYVVRGKVDERGGAAWIETANGQRVTATTTKVRPMAAGQ